MRAIKAKLLKKATADGLFEFRDEVELGRIYVVDADTMRTHTYWNIVQQIKHDKVVVFDIHNGGWLPVECLEFL